MGDRADRAFSELPQTELGCIVNRPDTKVTIDQLAARCDKRGWHKGSQYHLIRTGTPFTVCKVMSRGSWRYESWIRRSTTNSEMLASFDNIAEACAYVDEVLLKRGAA